MKSPDNLSSDFLLSIVTEKNMSLNTASSYAADLKIFFSFIKRQNLVVATVEKITSASSSKAKEKEVSLTVPFPEDYLLSSSFLNF